MSSIPMRLGVFDTETTGLPGDNKESRIVEVGVVVLEWRDGDGWVQVGEWDSLARPRRRHFDGEAFEEGLRASGITVSEIEAAHPDWRVAMALEQWLVEKKVGAATSFNRLFDFHPVLLANGTWLCRWNKVVFPAPCLQRTARDVVQSITGEQQKLPSLVEALTYFGLPIDPVSHRALPDARAAAALVPHIWPDGPDGWPPSSAFDPEWARWDGGHIGPERQGSDRDRARQEREVRAILERTHGDMDRIETCLQDVVGNRPASREGHCLGPVGQGRS